MAEEFDGFERGSSAMGTGSAGLGNSSNALGESANGQGVRERAADMRRDVLDRAVEKKDELKQRAAGTIDQQRTSAAQRVGAISRALTGAADSLRESGEPQLSEWVRQAAGQVERVVDYLEGKPVDGMVHDLEDMARSHPALFMGSTYTAGLALGRFLRASSPANHATDTERAETSRDWNGSAVADGGNPWTGSAVGPSMGGYRSSAGEAGLTDEDMRAAWHGDQAKPESAPGYGASASPSPDALDTGELTSYTNGSAAMQDDRDPRGM